MPPSSVTGPAPARTALLIVNRNPSSPPRERRTCYEPLDSTHPDTQGLTNQFHTIVAAAKQSVTCATYNFASTSQMWTALREASERPGVAVTLYLDAAVADVDAVRTQIPHAAVYRPTNSAAGRPIRSHAKFVVIDRRLTFLTSANFSYSAENFNVEFGLLIDDAALAESIEREMREHHSTLYERVEG